MLFIDFRNHYLTEKSILPNILRADALFITVGVFRGNLFCIQVIVDRR